MRGIPRGLRPGPGTLPPPDLPPYADWWWRAHFGRPRSVAARGPDTQLSDDAGLHHDCPLGEVLARPDGASVAIEVFGFRGTFLGLSVAPADAVRELRRRHVLRLDARIAGAAMRTYARLNLRFGDAVETQLRELPGEGDGLRRAEFDIAATRTETHRLDHLWFDLLFDAPRGVRLAVCDVLLVRHPRADL